MRKLTKPQDIIETKSQVDEIVDLYKDAGWKDVSFQAKDGNTVFRFRK